VHSSQPLSLPYGVIDPAFFPGRAATIYYRAVPQKHNTLSTIRHDVQDALHIKEDTQIGTLGILHPSVLAKFEIGYPCSALEFTLDPFKKQMQKIWTNDE
jgi:phenylalanyl-tRNA synthetase beta chain